MDPRCPSEVSSDSKKERQDALMSANKSGEHSQSSTSAREIAPTAREILERYAAFDREAALEKERHAARRCMVDSDCKTRRESTISGKTHLSFVTYNSG